MVTSSAATIGEKEIQTDWPITEGLTAGTTKLKKKAHLEPEDEDLTSDNVGL